MEKTTSLFSKKEGNFLDEGYPLSYLHRTGKTSPTLWTSVTADDCGYKALNHLSMLVFLSFTFLILRNSIFFFQSLPSLFTLWLWASDFTSKDTFFSSLKNKENQGNKESLALVWCNRVTFQIVLTLILRLTEQPFRCYSRPPPTHSHIGVSLVLLPPLFLKSNHCTVQNLQLLFPNQVKLKTKNSKSSLI